MAHIFISHATQDDAFITRLAADLKGSGVQTWVDHENILPGVDWDHAIEQGINACDVLLYVVTQASLDSVVCGDEWNHALSLGRVVIPIMYGAKLTNNDLPFRLKRRHWVDFRGDYDVALGKLLSALGVEALPKGSQAHKVIQESPLQVPTGFTLPMLEWCYIPAGKVTIEDHDYQVDAFYMGKYPVTVEQYEYFIGGSGYNWDNYWTQASWQWKAKNNIALPEFWDKPQWYKAKYPVVGVSWYEAIAFCRWLTGKTEMGILLPDEQQWQRAAQGDDEREYPWGNVFDPAQCNTVEGSIGTITSVDHYSNGVSPYGVYDMSGNVWEWCLNEWDEYEPERRVLEGSLQHVLRGGSFLNDQGDARAAYRSHHIPDARISSLGFRVCCTVPIRP